ncbi:MAG: hypothetical protein IIA83_07185 [Thaumarchaeota archaeon]|nr:hypothetical protein [Nitrososphaerota archaeon]
MALAEPNSGIGNEFNISDDFIEANKKFIPDTRRKKGGPYTKQEIIDRKNEVHRLHFEYGYSARKIADLMKVNRNTVNGDIDYWYSKIVDNTNEVDPSCAIMVNIQRLDIQRSRLREQLDKTETFQEKLALERLILEIDSRILNTHYKLANSTRNLIDYSTEIVNNWMKEKKMDKRFLTMFDMISVSEKAFEKIEKIITQDRLGSRSV